MIVRLSRIAGMIALALCATAGHALALEGGDVVVTVNRVIYPGQNVPADAVVETRLRQPMHTTSRVLQRRDELVGMVAAKTILPNRLIAPNAVRDAYAIEAGANTTVYYRQGALTIAMDAVALEPAGFGDEIRVRNTQSGRTITGIVMPDGNVAVEAR